VRRAALTAVHPRTRELLAYLDAQRVLLKAAFDAVPPEARDRPPAPGEWSAAGVIEHLALVEQRVAGFMSTLIAAAKDDGLALEAAVDPLLPTFDLARALDRATRVAAPDPLQPAGLEAAAAWTALERAGSALRRAAHDGDGFALGTIMRPHPLFGPLSLYQWIAFAGAHEARHAAQIRDIAAALGVAGSANASRP
jgi:DinB superfamily